MATLARRLILGELASGLSEERFDGKPTVSNLSADAGKTSGVRVQRQAAAQGVDLIASREQAGSEQDTGLPAGERSDVPVTHPQAAHKAPLKTAWRFGTKTTVAAANAVRDLSKSGAERFPIVVEGVGQIVTTGTVAQVMAFARWSSCHAYQRAVVSKYSRCGQNGR